MRTTFVRVAVVALLLGGGYLAVAPWIDCAFPLHAFTPETARICAFGTGIPAFDNTGQGPHWPGLLVGFGYVLASLWIALSRHIRFE